MKTPTPRFKVAQAKQIAAVVQRLKDGEAIRGSLPAFLTNKAA